MTDDGSTPTVAACIDAVVLATTAPPDRPRTLLDVHEMGPPTPLKRTLELLADLPSADVLIQYNDRTPQFLYSKLDDRGYRYATVAESEIERSAVDREPTDGSPLSIDGHASFNKDGQGGFNKDGQGGFNKDGQGGFNKDGQGGFNLDGDGGFNRDGQGGFNVDGDGVWTCIWRAIEE